LGQAPEVGSGKQSLGVLPQTIASAFSVTVPVLAIPPPQAPAVLPVTLTPIRVSVPPL